MERSAVRSRLLQWRSRLERCHVELESRRTAEKALTAMTSPRRVASYAACRGEIDPRPLLDGWGLDDGAIALPRVTDACLEFVTGWHRLEPQAFGITEPIDGTPTTLADVDVVLVPVVAFDINGNRLGHGHGYYDRALAAVMNTDPRPLLVGLAYDEQQLDEIAPDEWDIPLDMIITPTRVIDVGGAASGRS